MTWYPESFAKDVPMDDMNMRPDVGRGYPGRTHGFYTGPVVYPFGHGLSYSRVQMRFVSAPATVWLPSSTSSLLATASENGGSSSTSDGVVRVVELGEASCAALRFTARVAVESLSDSNRSQAAAVLLFARFVSSVPGAPTRQLVGFDRVWVGGDKGASAVAEILVNPCEHLSFADKEGRRVVPLGEHALEVVEDGNKVAAHRLTVVTSPAGI